MPTKPSRSIEKLRPNLEGCTSNVPLAVYYYTLLIIVFGSEYRTAKKWHAKIHHTVNYAVERASSVVLHRETKK